MLFWCKGSHLFSNLPDYFNKSGFYKRHTLNTIFRCSVGWGGALKMSTVGALNW
jgi:hypothetical protein